MTQECIDSPADFEKDSRTLGLNGVSLLELVDLGGVHEVPELVRAALLEFIAGSNPGLTFSWTRPEWNFRHRHRRQAPIADDNCPHQCPDI